MVWKFRFEICVFLMAGQVAMAQNSAGNPLTGDVKATVIQRYSGPAVLPKPDKIVIHEFTVNPGVVTTDQSIAAQLHRTMMLRHGVDEDSSPDVLARRVQAAFAKALADELKNVNTPIQKASATDGVLSGSDLIIEGDFTTINEGDKTKRIMIGFGRGASNVRTHVRVSLVTQGHSTVVLEFNLSSESGKKPGAAATMGIGSLAVGAAAGGAGDRNSTVEADASRMGKLVAKQVEAFMTDQKWISSTSVAPHMHSSQSR